MLHLLPYSLSGTNNCCFDLRDNLICVGVWGYAILHQLGAHQCHRKPEVECGTVWALTKWSMIPCTT